MNALGGLDLRDEAGEPLEALLKQPKRAALLIYLALAEPAGFHRRDTLLLLFWPDLTQDRARAALRKSLYVLRGAVGQDVILSRGDDELGIDWQHLECDVTAFTAALAAGRTTEALELYRADLLTGFHLGDASPEWEQWLDGRRATLRHLAAEAAWTHAKVLAQAGAVTEGIRWARWACDRTPDDEPAIRRLLALLGDLGDRAGALHFYDEFRNRIRADYGAQPAPETQELIRTIKSRVMTDAADTPLPEPPVPQPAAPVRERRRPTERPAPESAPVEVTPRPLHRRQPVLVALAVVAATVAALVFWRSGRTPPVEADLVAVAPFRVLSPELEVWREGLIDLLSRNLDGAGPLRSVSPARVMAGTDAGGSAADLGRRTGAGLVVTGTLLGLQGDSVRVTASVLDRVTDRELATLEIGGTTQRMDVVVDSLTRGLLRAIGGVRQVGSVAHASIGSTSVPALKAFLQGEQFMRRTEWDSARSHYEQAVALDTAFAMGWLRLGLVNTMTHWPVPNGPSGELVGLIQLARAAKFNHGLGPRDSLLITAQAEMARITLGLDPGDAAAAVHGTALEAARRFPDDPETWTTLGAVEQFLEPLGKSPGEIMPHYATAMALDSGYAPAVRFAMQLAGTLPDVDETRRLARRYLELVQDPDARRIPAAILTLLDPRGTEASRAAMLDTTAVEALWPVFYITYTLPDSLEGTLQLARALATRIPDSRYWFTAEHIEQRNLAAVLAYHGRLAEAFEQAGTENTGWFANLVGELAAFGAVPRQVADSTFVDWTTLERADGLGDAVPWWAANRDTVNIQRYIATRADPPGGSALGFLWLARGDTAQALTEFRATDGMTVLPRLTYIRLLVAAGQDEEALQLARRRAAPSWPIPSQVALRMERARLEEAIGDPAAAVANYRFVIDVWHNADAALQPFVEEAREALRRLGGAAQQR